MSSLRNSLHRRNHKERSQLAHRARLGILEKHKDYVLRARDYHSKQERIQRLRHKAAERNKDEFYFAMNKQKTVRGVHVQDRGNEALPTDVVKILKTQDENYLRTMRVTGLKKIDRLKNQLSALADLVKPGSLGGEDKNDLSELDEEEVGVLIESGIIPPPAKRRRRSGGSQKGKHVLFVESEAEARQYTSSKRTSTQENATDMSVDDINLGWKAPEEHKPSKRRRSKASRNDDEQGHVPDGDLTEQERREGARQHRAKLLKELSARLFRDRQLRYAERELEMQRLLMGKGGVMKLRGVEKVEDDNDEDDNEEDDYSQRRPKKVDEKTWKPRVYKWRVERKK